MKISFDYWYTFFVMLGVFTMAMTLGIGGLNEFLFVKRFKIHSGIAAGTSVSISTPPPLNFVTKK